MINPKITIKYLNDSSRNSMVEHLGIVYTDIGKDYISAKMPVDHRTHQPLGLLHGGASVALAETLGSVAATFSVDFEKYVCFGLEINANHVKSVREGWVFGTAKPVHLGKSTQIWEIVINNESGELVCISRLTLAVIKKSPEPENQ
jgi:1,4-dihydroxy-2-naphthoyl-CoA hydrolase